MRVAVRVDRDRGPPLAYDFQVPEIDDYDMRLPRTILDVSDQVAAERALAHRKRFTDNLASMIALAFLKALDAE